MKIGIPRERHPFECWSGLAPGAVTTLRSSQHSVFVERDAGAVARATQKATSGFVTTGYSYNQDMFNLGLEEDLNNRPTIELGTANHRGEFQQLSWFARPGG